MSERVDVETNVSDSEANESSGSVDVDDSGSSSEGSSPVAGSSQDSVTGPKKPEFVYVCNLLEDHRKAIYDVQFYKEPVNGLWVFATVAGNRAMFYECHPPESSEPVIKFLAAMMDADEDEVYYSCAWTWTEDDFGRLLAVAGVKGVIRILSVKKGRSVRDILGHTGAVNQLVFHPILRHLLLSASKDHTLRLWNIMTGVCVAIFGGVEGHRDEVITADFDFRGSKIVSGGMDHTIKVWKLNRMEGLFNFSCDYPEGSRRPFPTAHRNFPDFSTRDIHRNYVDSVRWFNEFIISKSCENEYVCWKAGKIWQKWDQIGPNTPETSIFCRLEVESCEVWFIRMSLDVRNMRVAVGNTDGKIRVWNIDTPNPALAPFTDLTHPKCTRIIRNTVFSGDGKIIIAVSDDGKVWRWDEKKVEVTQEQP